MTALATPRPAFSAANVVTLVRDRYGLDVQARQLDSERDQNFRLTGGDGAEFVLKIGNAAEDEAVADLQSSALAHLEMVAPSLPVPRIVPTATGATMFSLEHGGTRNICRLVTLLPGDPAGTRLQSRRQLGQLGGLLARLGKGLRGFFHPAARRELAWDLQQANILRRWTGTVTDPAVRAVVGAVLDEFDIHVRPVLDGLRAQVIHNDANPDNLLLGDGGALTGIIDFGDIVHAPLICDLAVACAYQLDDDDPYAGVLPIVAAYNDVTPLEAAEIGLLPRLIAVRLAATITISSWRASEHPDNRDYILGSQAQAIAMLQQLRTIPDERIVLRLRELCEGAALPPAESTAQLVARRDARLGPVYRLFYDDPVQIVRGEGVWLYDAGGSRYLDAYNNVACVGHCRDEVTAALTGQARRLNTHSRYLHTNIVDYAERLCELLPFEDPVCMFCCTGSEANELAYRIAVAHTGGRGVVVTDHAYHGNSYVTSQLSTSDTPPRRRDAFVATIEAPDSYRGAHRYGKAGLAERYAVQVEAALSGLADDGIGPTALLVDTVFSCDGVVAAPAGFLSRAAAHVRAGGGLLIADEVQAGFCRTGDAFWGFERHDVVPDIVTLGKPMGNGHPLAGVVCERATVEAFAGQIDYFNTFGGNPVSCAVGMAVLDVLENEGLQLNALQVGRYLRAQLREQQNRYDLIGDVRGAGLFTGVELVADRDTLAPAPEAARAIVNAMRHRGVLFSATGPHGNVLKIRPPLVFSYEHADYLVTAFEAVLAAGVSAKAS